MRLLLPLLALACTPDVECGAGTELVDGECVVAESDTDTDADSDSDSDADTDGDTDADTDTDTDADADNDDDGWATPDDCDDTDPDVNPDADEICGNGKDDDCDGLANGCGFEGEAPVTDDGIVLEGRRAYDEAGAFVTGGDLDGDGRSDLLVGAYHANDGAEDGGALYVQFGPVEAPMLLRDADIILTSSQANDRIGQMVVIGDLNGDSVPDLAVGAPNDEQTGAGTRGDAHVYLLWGPVDASVDLAVAADAELTPEVTEDSLGRALAVGDLNGDGQDDLVSTAWYSDQYTYTGGAVYVQLGPFTGNAAMEDADARLYGTTDNNYLGIGVAVADVDGDGVDDLFASADYDTVNGWFGPVSDGTIDSCDVQVSGLRVNRATQLANVGDFDGDGRDDLAMADSWRDGETGGAWVWSGAELTAGDHALTFAELRVEGTELNDRVGSSVGGAGDVDGDGLADLLIGAEGTDRFGSSGGSVHVFLGGSSGAKAPEAAHAIFHGDGDQWQFGRSVAGVGDTNADGSPDILVGAATQWGEAEDSGAAWLLLGTGF